MHRFGSILVAIGGGWMVLAAVAVIIFLLFEMITGTTPQLPRFHGVEVVGLLLYFGIIFGFYLGSWTFMASGMALIFLDTLIGAIRRKSRR